MALRSSYLHRPILLFASGVAGAFVCSNARADLEALLPQLTNPIEVAAARANQAVYDRLTLPRGGPDEAGICDPLLVSDPGEGACSGEVFRVFTRVRELVHNANELAGDGPTAFSLGLDLGGVGRALRWTAAEELAAQGNSATRFSGSQLNSLANRIAALRFSARGARVANAGDGDEQWLASTIGARGGGASADEELVKRWGGFIDGSFGYGRQEDTTNLTMPGSENAFDYDGLDITGGLDYRFGTSLVVGAIIGYTERRIDFDSRVSVVDGSIESDGASVIGYLLWEGDKTFITASLGTQILDHSMVRRISYPSFNPLLEPVDETALSTTDSHALLGSFAIGRDWRFGGFSVGPYLRGEYQRIVIDGFTERNANGFDLLYDDQEIGTFDAAVGLKMQQVFTPELGIVVPFLRGELHRQLGNDSRTIDAVYAGVADASSLRGAENFALATNDPDDQFYLAAAGLSVIFKHGLQVFLQYQRTFELEHIEDSVIAGGVRFEF